MKTRSPVATISYNSVEFLRNKLIEFGNNGTISSWFFVRHFAENDEKKDHIHLWICPNKTIDTMEIQKQLEEPDSDPEKKPLKCIDFVKSNIDDAILYFAHYVPYLACKLQSRHFHYDFNMFVVSDEDWFEYQVNHALTGSDFAVKHQVLQKIQENTNTLSELISTGIVPLNLASQVAAYGQLLDNDRVFRAGRKTHTPKNGVTVTPDGIVGGGGVKLN